jgi:hypothetical protein
MSTSADDRRSNATAMQERPSVDEWIIGLLKGKGAQTLDQLADSLPGVNWAQFFLAVDRLSRSGQVLLWHRQRGDYLVSLKGNEPAANLMLAS